MPFHPPPHLFGRPSDRIRGLGPNVTGPPPLRRYLAMTTVGRHVVVLTDLHR
jgi:hypothetical protein